MLYGVYKESGICVRSHCGAEPPRDFGPPRLVQQSVGEIERQLGMPRPAMSKHLRVPLEASFVESTTDAQRRLYQLKPKPLQEIDAWLAHG